MKKKLKPNVKTSVSVPSLTELPTETTTDSVPGKNTRDKSATNGKEQVKTNGKTNGHLPIHDYTEELDSRELLQVLNEVKAGNFSVRLPEDKSGISSKICDAVNHIISLNE